MKVRMLTAISGADICAMAGDVVERSEAEAKRFIAAGIAEAVATPKQTTAKKPAAKKG